MKCILMLDVNNGMLFNHRRLSRDKCVIKDVLDMTVGHKLYTSDFSVSLFEYMNPVTFYENPFATADEHTYVFSENISPLPYLQYIDEFIIYYWGKEYPSDMRFSVNLKELGFHVISTTPLPTKTHPDLQRVILRR